jgi:hypothetical protein
MEKIGPEALHEVLALNNEHAEELSWLTIEKLKSMLAEAFYARKAGSLDAFMIAFDQNADYDSPNFLWFKEKFPRFIYVDRIAVAAAARGRGLARKLYEDLFSAAHLVGHTIVCCEVNAEPPNPASDAFHEAMEFSVIGAATLDDGAKTVRYFARQLV